MSKKLGMIIAIAILITATVIVMLCIPRKTKITVSYTNPQYSTMQVAVKIDPRENIGGFDMSLLYNTAKWELQEDSVQHTMIGMNVITEDGKIRLVCENSKKQTLHETVVTMSFEMIRKNDDPLGILLEVEELYNAEDALEDIPYTVEYIEGSWQ